MELKSGGIFKKDQIIPMIFKHLFQLSVSGLLPAFNTLYILSDYKLEFCCLFGFILSHRINTVNINSN